MNFSIDKEENRTVLRLHDSKLDSTGASTLKSELKALVEAGNRNIAMDLKDVRYVDSSGLSVILSTNALCKEQKGSFKLANLQDHVMKVIKISQLDSILNIGDE